MEPWVKRMLVMPVVMLALVCLVAAFGAAQAREDGGRPGESDQSEEGFGLDYIPLRGDGVDMAVRGVVLVHNGKTYLLETGEGLEVKSQNRLPLARIPLLAQFTDPPYERPAFADQHRIADVSANGKQLFVNLPGTSQLPASVVIFNQNNAFFLKEQPSSSSNPIPFTANVIGGAFRQKDENNLLIMVRPSIIMDGGLF